MKFFNTAGPNQADIHYTLDPLSRWDLEEILHLIHTRKYFVLHAPGRPVKPAVCSHSWNISTAKGNTMHFM